MAELILPDAESAREAWLESDPKQRESREATDFLKVVNFDGESLDFHALRHTTGAWL